MNELTPLEAAYLIYRAEYVNPPSVAESLGYASVFEAGWKACESARRREAPRAIGSEPSISNETGISVEAKEKIIEILRSIEKDIGLLQLDSRTLDYTRTTGALISDLQQLLKPATP
jgi:hypothetical protein